LKSRINNNRVFVGLSGGVDSAVSAALLKKEGYDVTGVFIQVWQPDWIECNWKEERLEAMRVAAHLSIPFITLDLTKEYKREVIDYMIREYTLGRTPNPDVMCNRAVKFGAFWKYAKKMGADYIATGHYAKNKNVSGVYKLLTSKDENKDQTYFLWTLNQDDLKHSLFPVGNLLKSEVRDLARKFRLPNSEKKDSQGLCFIGKIDVKEFLKHYIRTERGDVLNEDGEIIGYHQGSVLLTIGERHGFTITRKSTNDLPSYIISKNTANNTITVSCDKTRSILTSADLSTNVFITNVNWIGNIPASNAVLSARSRYHASLSSCKIIIESNTVNDISDKNHRNATNNKVKVVFDTLQSNLASGQSLVIYDNDECLGGGILV